MARLLSLAVHELRTPVTVAAGYMRMLLQERAGPLSDAQRRLMEEAEKSCSRLAALVAEMGDLSNLEAGTWTFNLRAIDAAAVLREAVTALPPPLEHDVPVDTRVAAAPLPMQGDPTRLRAAFGAILGAIRRELSPEAALVVQCGSRQPDGQQVAWIAMGDGTTATALAGAAATALGVFDEWRGGNGLSLMVARRIVEAHGGSVWSPPGERPAPGAVIMLPLDNR
jgi:signal transduction histidine kinase